MGCRWLDPAGRIYGEVRSQIVRRIAAGETCLAIRQAIRPHQPARPRVPHHETLPRSLIYWTVPEAIPQIKLHVPDDGYDEYVLGETCLFEAVEALQGTKPL